MKSWFNNICSNYKYSNKGIYCEIYNKSKEAFWVPTPLSIEKITICNGCTTRVSVLYISIDVWKKT